MIDPLKATVDALLAAAPRGHCAAPTPTRLDTLLSASLERITSQLAEAGEALTPIQRQQIAVLVRTTLDVFALVEPDARDCGMTTLLRRAVARLLSLEPELARVLVRHSAHVAAIEPLLDGLTVDLPTEPADKPAPRASDQTPARAPFVGPASRRTSTTGPAPDVLADAVEAVEEAIASLEDALATGTPAPRVQRRGDGDAFRWLLDLACAPPMTEAPLPPESPEPPRLAQMVRALWQALASPILPPLAAPTQPAPPARPARSPASGQEPDRSPEQPTAPHPALPVDRQILTWLLAPIRYELEVAAPPAPAPAPGRPGQPASPDTTQPPTAAAPPVDDAPPSPPTAPQASPTPNAPTVAYTPNVLAPPRTALEAVIARIQRVIDDATIDVPSLPHAILAELRAILEPPPFAISLNVPANLDTVRWLWIAAYLYGGPQRRPDRPVRRRRPETPARRAPSAPLREPSDTPHPDAHQGPAGAAR